MSHELRGLLIFCALIIGFAVLLSFPLSWAIYWLRGMWG